MKPKMMKHKIRSLEDIYREKQKVQKEIALHEYAVNLHFKEIKNKMSFVSIAGYAYGLLKNQLASRLPGAFAGFLRSVFSTRCKVKKS
jgi:hypothetical protein